MNMPTALIVDDREDQRKLYGMVEEYLQVRALIVSNVQEALDAFKSHTIDIVLLDVKMPERDGYECARLIRELDETTGKHTPILGVSASVFEGDADKCMTAGMDAFIRKPFSLAELKNTVHSLLGSQVS
jgi:CheY-like chemotaxis protein